MIDLLERQGGLAWVQARAVGDRVVVTGLAAPDATGLLRTPPRGGGRASTAGRSPASATVTVGKLGAPPLVARPFCAVAAARRCREGARSATPGLGRARAAAVGGDRRVGDRSPRRHGPARYAVAGASGYAELAQTRLREMTPLPGHQRAPAGVLVLGDGDQLTAWVRAARVDAARLALMPGVLRVYDWEASALLPDGTTVAEGIERGVSRATTTSRRRRARA